MFGCGSMSDRSRTLHLHKTTNHHSNAPAQRARGVVKASIGTLGRRRSTAGSMRWDAVRTRAAQQHAYNPKTPFKTKQTEDLEQRALSKGLDLKKGAPTKAKAAAPAPKRQQQQVVSAKPAPAKAVKVSKEVAKAVAPASAVAAAKPKPGAFQFYVVFVCPAYLSSLPACLPACGGGGMRAGRAHGSRRA